MNHSYSTGKDPLVSAIHELGIVTFFRSSAYVNLNDIAKPFGKRMDNWTRLKQTKDLFAAFETEPCYRGMKPVISVVGRNANPADVRELKNLGCPEPRPGTWAHPDIAIQFAQWCSPRFALWVSRQIRHLLTYGEVNLHYTEWSGKDRAIGRQCNDEDAREIDASILFLRTGHRA